MTAFLWLAFLWMRLARLSGQEFEDDDERLVDTLGWLHLLLPMGEDRKTYYFNPYPLRDSWRERIFWSLFELAQVCAIPRCLQEELPEVRTWVGGDGLCATFLWLVGGDGLRSRFRHGWLTPERLRRTVGIEIYERTFAIASNSFSARFGCPW